MASQKGSLLIGIYTSYDIFYIKYIMLCLIPLRVFLAFVYFLTKKKNVIMQCSGFELYLASKSH